MSTFYWFSITAIFTISPPLFRFNVTFNVSCNSLTSILFLLQYHTQIKHLGHEDKGNDDNQLRKLLTVKYILLVNTLKNV